MNDKYRKALLLIISIFIVILITLGVSYAYMKSNVSGAPVTSLSVKSCAKISLIDSESTVINLDNTYPMSDNRGRQTEPYRFKVSSFCEDIVGFNLYFIFPYEEFQPNNIKYLITNAKTGEDIAFGKIGDLDPDSIDDFSDDDISEIAQMTSSSNYDIFKVFTNYLSYKGEKEYDLRLWIDEDADNDSMDMSQEIVLIIKSFSREESFAEYIINTYDEDSNLYYHDENLENGAEDYSYRYAGNDPDNYVCFGSNAATCPEENLYRIIGVFDNKVKLIKAIYATTDELGTNGDYSMTYDGNALYHWDNEFPYENIWKFSRLNTVNLNTNFLNYLGSWSEKISVSTWYVGGISSDSGTPREFYDTEVGVDRLQENDKFACYIGRVLTECTATNVEVTAKIGLMYISDYYYSTTPDNWENNMYDYFPESGEECWMYISDSMEWPITPGIMFGKADFGTFYLGGTVFESDGSVGESYVVRPTFYLNETVHYNTGSGTSSNPYRIS